ncbi:hypothetical protein R3P38DRAFT_3220729 [Favolaschia claudopus]|uniref:Uncharacterized protein n=1 Tax=Favolaschia claudopus TaxID=2862362 RepID=A0AAW0A186_9AGAR
MAIRPVPPCTSAYMCLLRRASACAYMRYASMRLLRRYYASAYMRFTPTCVSYGDTSASAYMHLRLRVFPTAIHPPVPTCTYAYVCFLRRYIRQCLHAPTPTCVSYGDKSAMPTCTYAYMRPYGDKSASAYRHLRLYASPTAIRLPAPTCATLVSVSYGDTSARAYMRLHCQRPHASTMNHMRLGYTCTCMHKLIQQGMVSL